MTKFTSVEEAEEWLESLKKSSLSSYGYLEQVFYKILISSK
jgi:hypothetical protein